MGDSDDEGLLLEAVFTEPSRPPSPSPTIFQYHRYLGTNRVNSPPEREEIEWDIVEIRLVGSHPLWGHHLWNAARSLAPYLDANPSLYRGKTVLELGAGGGLPGIVTGLNGASKVILTDYPDKVLIDNLEHNVARNLPSELIERVLVRGYRWGQPVESLLEMLGAPSPRNISRGFDLIILSDLIFNHSQHDALLNTCQLALESGDSVEDACKPSVLVFYTHHRPHLAHRDMEFFSKARERSWTCEKIVTDKFQAMFPEDPGEEEVRSTVHGWKLTKE